MVSIDLPLPSRGQVAGVAGAASVAAGLGLTAERIALARIRTEDDPYRNEDFGSVRGRPGVLLADDGVELYVEVDEAEPAVGSRAGDPTIVFVHGYGLNMDSWHFQRKQLRGSARMVFADQRSHGRSGRAPSRSITMDQLGHDVRRILQATCPEGPVILVGHSMGGMTLMAFADLYPEWVGDRVVGFGLVTTSAGGLGDVALGVRGALAQRLHHLGSTATAALSLQPLVVDYARRKPSDLGFLITRHFSFASDVPDSVVDFAMALSAGTPIEVIRDFLPIFAAHDRVAALPTMGRVPTAVVAATHDYLTPVEHGRALAAALPGTEYLELDDAGHLAKMEYPDRVTAHLQQLLSRVRDSGPRAR
jgi:pimeloyl-ACP methyl ester carboxylesterase